MSDIGEAVGGRTSLLLASVGDVTVWLIGGCALPGEWLPELTLAAEQAALSVSIICTGLGVRKEIYFRPEVPVHAQSDHKVVERLPGGGQRVLFPPLC